MNAWLCVALYIPRSETIYCSCSFIHTYMHICTYIHVGYLKLCEDFFAMCATRHISTTYNVCNIYLFLAATTMAMYVIFILRSLAATTMAICATSRATRGTPPQKPQWYAAWRTSGSGLHFPIHVRTACMASHTATARLVYTHTYMHVVLRVYVHCDGVHRHHKFFMLLQQRIWSALPHTCEDCLYGVTYRDGQVSLYTMHVCML
jgi:hypothetical protein